MNGAITSSHIIQKYHNSPRRTFNCPIWKLYKETLLPHGKCSHLHFKGANIIQIFVGMMKKISHKLVGLCCFVGPGLDLFSLLMVTFCIFELRKMKVVKNEKNQ